MVLRVLNPLGEINKAPEGKPLRPLEALEGRRLGLLWSRHTASVNFWPALEEVVEARYRPSEIHRLYKRSTWNPATPAEIEEFARKVDFAVVGVGA